MLLTSCGMNSGGSRRLPQDFLLKASMRVRSSWRAIGRSERPLKRRNDESSI